MLKRFLKVISVPIAIILVLPLLIVCSITYIFIGKYSPIYVVNKYMEWIDC